MIDPLAVTMAMDSFVIICMVGYWFYGQYKQLVEMEETIDRIEELVEKLGKR